MNKLIKSPKFKRVGAVILAMLCMAVMSFSCFAAEGQGDVASEAVSAASSAFTTISSTVSIANIMKALGIALAAAVGFFFFWWAIRKVVRMVSAAFKKGKISV